MFHHCKHKKTVKIDGCTICVRCATELKFNDVAWMTIPPKPKRKRKKPQ